MAYTYDRRERHASAEETPADTAKRIETLLSGFFRDGYFKVTVDRGVLIEAGRMDQEAFAKLQVTKGYESAGENPYAKILIIPAMGSNIWEGLSVKSAFGAGSDEEKTLKLIGVTPFRKGSGLTPEKAVKVVVEWFKKNADKLIGSTT